MNYLDGVRTIEGIQTALENLPQGSEAYDSMYQATMKRIESQSRHDKELALRVLLWISSAKRPLTPLELQHALATKVNTLRTTALPEIQDIISVCGGLVTVEEGNNSIGLVHHTVQEFLQRQLLHSS